MKKYILTLVLLGLASCAYAADANQWYRGNGGIPLKGVTKINDIDTESQAYAFDPLDRLLTNYRQGLVLTYNDASTIIATAGEVVVTDGTTKLMLKNAGNTTINWTMIDTGAEAPSTTYYVYATATTNADTAITYKISLSASAPSGATWYKRIGSFTNDVSSNITASSIVNDNTSTLVEVQNNKVNLGGKTLENAVLGQTTTGSSAAFNAGTTIAIPAGCYVTGGYKQVDGNFIRWDYACP